MKTIRMMVETSRRAPRVKRIRFEGDRDQITLLAGAIGWYDFSDAESRIFRAQPPGNKDREWATSSRNRTTLPDFGDLGDGAWKLLRWFQHRAPVHLRTPFLALLAEQHHGTPLFNTELESYDVARMITETALGVLTVAEANDWL